MKNKILLLSATNYEHNHEEIHGIPIHIIGIGRVNAALNTYKLIQKYKPDYVVEFGSCGNLKDHKVGEVLEVGTVYDDFYGGPVSNHPPIEISDSNIKLFSTDTFFEKGAQYSNHYSKMVDECNIIEMEGYSIAKVCSSENISLSLYKWVSDDGSNSEWLENAKAGFENFKIIFKEKFL
jgi:adenosylhomocysteine nucleosidase